MRRIFEQILNRPGTRMALVHATSKVLGLALGIFVARALGAESYGIYTYTLAWMALLSAIGSAGVPRLLMREIAAASTQANWQSLRADVRRGTALVLMLSGSIAALGYVALLLFGDTLGPDVLATTAGMLILLPLAVLVTLSGHILQGLQRVVTGMWVELVMRPACMLILLTIAVFGINVELTSAYAMFTQIAGALLTLALALALVKRALPARASEADDSGHAPRPWLNSMMPFTLISLAAVISGNTNIIMLGQLSDAEQVGIYRVAVQGSLLVTFSLQVVNAIITPQIAALYAAGKLAELQALVRRSARLITLTALPAAALLVLIGEWLIVTLFGPAFAASYLPLTVLACGTLVTAMFGSVSQILDMTGNERETARALWLTTGANVLLNFILIPPLEALGAAIATACSVVMWNILLYRKVRSKVGINPTVLSGTTLER